MEKYRSVLLKDDFENFMEPSYRDSLVWFQSYRIILKINVTSSMKLYIVFTYEKQKSHPFRTEGPTKTLQEWWGKPTTNSLLSVTNFLP